MTDVKPEGAACRMHGGASLVGVASPKATHMRNSKTLPKHIRTNYDKAMENQDYLSLRREIALIDTRLELLKEQLGDSNVIGLFKKLPRMIDWLVRAIGRGDTKRVGQLIVQLQEMAERGGEEIETWHEMYQVMGIKSGLVTNEMRMMVAMGLMVTAEEQLASIQFIENVLRDEIRDPVMLNRIGKRLRLGE